MKSIFQLLLILTAFILLASCSDQKEEFTLDKTGAFYINKNQDTYEVYSNRGVLILEFTPENTDPETLITLDYIYETVKEFYDREYEEEETEITTKTI